MMLRWISLVPPMIELARVDRNRAPTVLRRRHRRRRASAGRRDRARRARSRPGAGSCPPRTASRGSTPSRSPRRGRVAPSVRCVVQAEDLDVDPRLREPLTHDAGRRVAPRARARLGERSIATSCSTCSRQMNDAPRSLASVVFATRQPSCSGPMRLLDRDLDVVEEDLVELALAGDLAQRTHLDARRRHRDRQHRDPLVRRRARIGSHQRDAPGRRSARTTTTPSGPSRRRRRRASRRASTRPARSLPASGSLNSWHHTSSPARIRGIHRRRCSSVPCAINVGPTRLTPTRPRSGGAPARASSSL